MELWADQGRPAMSNDDDPFGRRDRTIIRPNPGGRRPPPPPAARPAAPPPPTARRRRLAPTPPVSYPPPPAAPAAAAHRRMSRRARRHPHAAAAPDRRLGRLDERAGRAPTPTRRRAAPPPMTPAPVSPHVSVDLVTVASIPLTRAAASLLLLLGRLARLAVARAGAGPADGPGRAGDPAVRDATRGPAARRPDQVERRNTRSPPPPTTSCRTCRARTAASGRSTACWSASSASAWAA